MGITDEQFLSKTYDWETALNAPVDPRFKNA
jgi:hypothetical protein